MAIQEQLLEPSVTSIEVKYEGAKYSIMYDSSRKYLQPKWYVQRWNDLRVSERFYSRPHGAFWALTDGRINWTS